MRKTIKKGTILLALLLSFTLFTTDIHAANSGDGTKVEAGEKTGNETKGKSLTLEKKEGTVTIENAKGKTVDLRDGAKLYNGYRVTTDEGYAWLALDGTKLIKLDWNSEAVVKKNKKKYEVLLESGALFFNVSKPLEDNENLDIRTSTMSTGIRGTLGKVSVDKLESGTDTEAITTVELYEGKVEISYHSRTGAVKSKYVEVPYQARVSTTRQDVKGAAYAPVADEEQKKVDLKEALENCGFIAIEIKDDKDLQERLLNADNGIGEKELQEIIDHAEEQLRIDQENARAEAADSEKQLQEILLGIVGDDNEGYVDQVFTRGEDGTKNTQESENTDETETEAVTEDTEETDGRKKDQTENIEETTEQQEEATESTEVSNSNAGNDDSNRNDSGKDSDNNSDKNTGNSNSGKNNSDNNTGNNSSGNNNGNNSSNNNSGNNNSGNNNSGNDNNSGDNTETPEPPAAQTFTVNFQYDGKPYAKEQLTQTVTGMLVENPKAQKPLLQPTKNGYWSESANGSAYDFDTLVEKNMTLYWVTGN